MCFLLDVAHKKYLGSIALKKCFLNILCSIRVSYFLWFCRSYEARRTSNKHLKLQWVWHTSGVCIRKQPHSLTEQPKSHRNKCVTVSILFISVFQRKKLRSRNTHNAHTRQQAVRPEHISGHWMWRVAKTCLLTVWVGSQNMWSSASRSSLSIQQTTSKKLHSANVWRASDKVRCRAGWVIEWSTIKVCFWDLYSLQVHLSRRLFSAETDGDIFYA